jgi:CRP/FNR family transcriptional regulator
LIPGYENNSSIQSFKTGDVIMRTGQYKQYYASHEASLRFFREGENGGEFLMYYLPSGQACAVINDMCNKSQTSQIMARAVDDVELMLVPLSLMEWMMEHRG